MKSPDPPENSKASAKWKADNAGLFKSLIEEAHFWREAGTPTEEELRAEGKMQAGIYADLVNELLRDLGDKYIPLLGIIHEDDVPYLKGLVEEYTERDHNTKCPEPPSVPGESAVIIPAYQQKCCDLKTPLIDMLMSKYNSFISARIMEAQSNYKQYINGIINIVQLDPRPGNKKMVYRAVANYFNFVVSAIQSYKVLDPYMTCQSGMTPEEADGIIKSARNVGLKCPSWLKKDINLVVAKAKLDCTGFNIEAEYELVHAGVDKRFTTGTSTLYMGAGIKGSFKGIASGSIKQQVYVTFDHNNKFSDLGLRGSAAGNAGMGAISADIGYDFALNAGFNAQAKGKIGWVEGYQKAFTFSTK